MKITWGSRNASTRHIWLKLELVKKLVECLEYIVVHQLVHLNERHRNNRFNVLVEQDAV